MQLRLKPRTSRNLISTNLVIKITLFVVIFFVGIFLIDKIDFPSPTKLIKEEINNDKIITLK